MSVPEYQGPKSSAELAPGEHWTNPCTVDGCRVITQGGRKAHEEHIRVVHPEVRR